MKEDPTINQILANCYLSTKVFSKTMFPERFTRPFASLTDKIFEALDDTSVQLLCIAAARGWGKTSIVNMSYPAKKILFREKKFIVPISCTATQAVLQGENLKRKLLLSERIKKFFGPMKSEVFAKDMWITSTGTMVLPRGAGQQVRGFLSDDDRPDLIIVDDLEDKEAVQSPDQRAKIKDWFFSDVVNAVDRSSKDWKIVVIGSVLHEDSLLVNLQNDPSWHGIQIDLCDSNYHSNWQDFMTDDEVRELAEQYASRGQLHIFFMEYMNSVIPSDAPFQERYFKYYEDDNSLSRNKDVDNIVILEPSKSTNPSSDYTAIVGIGVDSKKPAIYVRDIVNKRLHPEEMYDETYAMCKRLNSRILGYEETGLSEFISYPLKTYMLKKGFCPEFVGLKSRGGPKNAGAKQDRIRALVPFYRMGNVYHNRGCCAPLEAQLLAFPRSKKDDIMDGLAYVIEMLEIGERYFSGPEDGDIEKEFEELEYEGALDNWRVI